MNNSGYSIVDTKKLLMVMGISILFTEMEDLLKANIQIASLLGVMVIGFIISERLPRVGKDLSIAFNKIWVFAQMLLFVLVGAEVDIKIALRSGAVGLLIISIGLVARSLGVIISLKGSDLNKKEKLFCIIAYTPKATVQAAIGSIPLGLGVEGGDVILAIAVLCIMVTAPLGAIGIKTYGGKLLEK